jgi:hypothetical protein
MENRGRPSENVVKLTKWELEYRYDIYMEI